jgi:hypothetical protein
MKAALAWWLQHGEQRSGDALLYEDLVLNQKTKFQYPPFTLFITAAIQKLQLHWSEKSFTQINFALVLTMAFASGLLLHVFDGGEPDNTDRRAKALVSVLLGTVATLTFYPVMKAFTLGQIQVWINTCFALAFLCLVTGRRAIPGGLIGFSALIKPHFALFLLWGALRRQWSFCASFALVFAAGSLAGFLVFGWDTHTDYLKILAYIAERGEAYFPNQSLNGVLNRLMGIELPDQYSSLHFFPDRYPPHTPWIHLCVTAFSLLMLASALLRRPKNEPQLEVDFCIFAVSLTLASPIAWEHHWGILLPIFLFLLATLRQYTAHLVWTLISYMLAASFLEFTNMVSDSEYNLVQSYLFLAALMVLALLHFHPRFGQTNAVPISTGR